MRNVKRGKRMGDFFIITMSGRLGLSPASLMVRKLSRFLPGVLFYKGYYAI